MRTNWNLWPTAVAVVRELGRQWNMTEGEIASILILDGATDRKNLKQRNGILLARNDGVPVTREEVNACLHEK